MSSQIKICCLYRKTVITTSVVPDVSSLWGEKNKVAQDRALHHIHWVNIWDTRYRIWGSSCRFDPCQHVYIPTWCCVIHVMIQCSFFKLIAKYPYIYKYVCKNKLISWESNARLIVTWKTFYSYKEHYHTGEQQPNLICFTHCHPSIAQLAERWTVVWNLR